LDRKAHGVFHKRVDSGTARFLRIVDCLPGGPLEEWEVRPGQKGKLRAGTPSNFKRPVVSSFLKGDSHGTRRKIPSDRRGLFDALCG